MNNLPIDTLVIVAGAILALLLLVKFWRTIARFALILAGIAAVIIVALALLNQAVASKEAAQAAHAASIGQSVTSVIIALVIGGLGTLVLGALGTAGFFWIRWKLEQRQKQLPQQQRRALSQQEPEIVYITQDDGFDLAELDLTQWGF